MLVRRSTKAGLRALELAYERNKLLRADEHLAAGAAQPQQSSGTTATPLAIPPLEFGELAEDALLLAKQVRCRTTEGICPTPTCHKQPAHACCLQTFALQHG